MIIGNYQAFNAFIGKDNIQNIDSLRNCIAQLNKICSCQKQKKNQKSEECNNIYIMLVNNNIASMIDYLRTKTTDSEIVFNHNSHHEIRRIKLR